MGPVAPAARLSNRRKNGLNMPNLAKRMDLRRVKAALPRGPQFRPHSGTMAVPSERPTSFLRAFRLALLSLALGAVLLWPTPTEAQTTCSTSDDALAAYTGTLTDLVTDCTTLLGLMDTLSGMQTLNWATNVAMGSWEGITVDGTPLRVTEQDLNQKGLTGSIPAALGDLSGLTYLNLEHNNLTGAIPTDLGDLTSLTYLNLGNNFGLTGSIPTELNQLTALTYLSINNSPSITSLPDLSALTNLEELYLHANNFTGTFPTWLGSLTNLTHLHLFGTAQKDLDGLGLTGPIPNLNTLTNLEELSIDGNGLTGTIPTWFNTLTSLDRLDLDRNRLTGEIPDLSPLTSMTHLDLASNRLTGEIPDLSALRGPT